jgi:hypothetical protein
VIEIAQARRARRPRWNRSRGARGRAVDPCADRRNSPRLRPRRIP